MTTAAILQILAGIGGIAAIWMRDYFSAGNVAERKKEAADEAINQGRDDLSSGNADAVAVRIDRVCADSGSGDAGIAGDATGDGGASTVSRLAALGIGDGKAARKS